MDGYGVDPAALEATAHGINGAMAELKTLGIDAKAHEGRGFSAIALGGTKVGHTGLQTALHDFAERWEWGVRNLMGDGDEFAQRLGLAAGAYYENERFCLGLVKNVANDLVGNPHVSDDEVTKGSFSDIGKALHPDYSAKSFADARHNMAQTWAAEGRDLSEGPMGVGKYVESGLGIRDQMESSRDQTFGAQSRPKAEG